MKAVFIFFIPGFFVSFVFPFFLPAFLVYSLHCLHSSFHRFFVCLLLPSDPPCCVPLFLPSFLLSFFLSFFPSFLPLSLPSFHPSILPSFLLLLWFYIFSWCLQKFFWSSEIVFLTPIPWNPWEYTKEPSDKHAHPTLHPTPQACNKRNVKKWDLRSCGLRE